jgi:thioredoxin-like negative regulator of GroEL
VSVQDKSTNAALQKGEKTVIDKGQRIQAEALRHPISSSFLSTEQEISAALEQAQRAGALSETIDTTDVATTLFAIVQRGYVLARALQDPQQMDKALRGALALLESIEGREHHADRTILHHVFAWRDGFPLYISATTDSQKSRP